MRCQNVSKALAGLAAAALTVAGTFTTPSVMAQASSTATVRSQSQLNTALKNSKVVSIVIRTSKNTNFKIKAGDYRGKKLVIASPKATVDNYGNFKKITIRDGGTVYDRGHDNDITISDTNKLKLVSGKQSYDTEVKITSSGAKIAIVNNGGLDEIEVKGSSDITLRGSAMGHALEVENEATGSTFTTRVKTKFSMEADGSVTLEKGAEGSSIKAEKASVKVGVTNHTAKTVKFTDSKGNTVSVGAGETLADAKSISSGAEKDNTSDGDGSSDQKVVAQVSINGESVDYTDLALAVSSASKADAAATIRLAENITGGVYNFTQNKSGITLDLNGHTITDARFLVGKKGCPSGLGADLAPYIIEGTALTVTDSSSGKKGVIQCTSANTVCLGVYYASKLELDGGVTVQSEGTAVQIYGDQRMVKTGSKQSKLTSLTVNKAKLVGHTGTVILWGGCSATVNSGAEITCEAASDGNPGFAIGGNGSYTKDSAKKEGDRNNGANITVNGGVIDGGAYNAGIYQPQEGTLTINGGTISGCVGVNVKAGTANINGGVISCNKSHYGTGGGNPDIVNDSAVNCALAMVETSSCNYGYDVQVNVTGGTCKDKTAVLLDSVASSNDYTLYVSADMQESMVLTYPSDDTRRQYNQANDDGLTITTKEVIVISDMLVRY